MSLKNSSGTIGNGTRDLPVCRVVPLDGGKFSNSRYNRFVPENEAALHREHEAGWVPTRYGRLWEAKISSTVPEIEPRIVQP